MLYSSASFALRISGRFVLRRRFVGDVDKVGGRYLGRRQIGRGNLKELPMAGGLVEQTS